MYKYNYLIVCIVESRMSPLYSSKMYNHSKTNRSVSMKPWVMVKKAVSEMR